MKVKDLIAKLQTMPQDSEVLLGESDYDISAAFPVKEDGISFEEEWENEDGSEFKNVVVLWSDIPD
jgi:hypothetical protein